MVPDFIGTKITWDRLFSGTYQEIQEMDGDNKCYVYGIMSS